MTEKKRAPVKKRAPRNSTAKKKTPKQLAAEVQARLDVFDEAQYRTDLIELGLTAGQAADVAQRTAQAQADSAARKRREQGPQPVGALMMRALPEKMPVLFEAPAAEKPKKPSREKPIRAVYDYRTDVLPARVRDLIQTYLSIEESDAKSAGTLGFMTRALAIATLPHRSVNDYRFVRKNGDFTLTMMTSLDEGLPYGALPRLLLTWVCTEAVQTGDRVLFLGDTLASYLSEMGLHPSGGPRGDITRLKHSMKTLFAAIISARHEGRENFTLANVTLADRIDFRTTEPAPKPQLADSNDVEWWAPQTHDEAGQWSTRLQLSEPFFKECIAHPIPIDFRAMGKLRTSPLALDIYVWLTHRMSYLRSRTLIPWVSLSGQFGAGYASTEQGLRDFKRAFIREMKNVLIIYPEAKVMEEKHGLVLYPSPTHVLPDLKRPKQPSFKF